MKLTNWQVPKSPQEQYYDALKEAAKPLDMKDYENMGQVEMHKDTDSVINKMISKQERARGQKIDKKETRGSLSFGGINDDREDKVYWRAPSK